MIRRSFLALVLLPVAAMAAPLDYSPGLVQQRLAAGETLFVDFKADWCTTCRAQTRVMDALKAADPAYEQQITFVEVDWDQYGRSELAQSLNIPRRSTLVVLRGDRELGRIVAGTSQAEIQALMDLALGAAGS
ncbi:thioredoxin family protein [Roseisalinus antarcticus]|uniref:Thioredoxin n=1 Tax=Roseisalinus antarcticus TaxID=254357 RepID=A0A1Y5TX52_9RHOB|nr:thioredoxin family protein [Roseisalinus antarcticus]SLN75900.1 Thioredoxin [Roseisalinus antarcticus]